MAALQAASLLSSRTSAALRPSVTQKRPLSKSSPSPSPASPLVLTPPRLTSSPLLPHRRLGLSVTNVAQKPSEVQPRTSAGALDDMDIPPVTPDRTSPALASTSGDESSDPSFSGRRIFMSDVVAKQKRPYFVNRKYTAKDIQYLAYMATVHGLCLFAPFTFSWDAFAVFVGLYVITGMFGITLSYHRNLSHKSFVLPKWLEYAFAYCGIQAIQGPPLEWVSAHRFHHRYCDTDGDPHTPYEGFWYSHMGWLLDDEATQARVGIRNNIADMQNDPFYNFIEETYPWHIVASAALLYAVGGFPYLVWGFAVRAVWVYHITWFVNSASHVWGYQSWNTGDLSRNNWWVGILAFGEGWHNNHHAFEYSCRHGLEWWQYDPTWYTVKMLEALGLATKLRYPTSDHRARLSFPAANKAA